MRVLYVCADPGIDVYGNKGAAVHVRSMCRALAAGGADVVLVCTRAEGTPPAGFTAYTAGTGAPVQESPRAVHVAAPGDGNRTTALLGLMQDEPEMSDALRGATRSLLVQAGHAALLEYVAREWAPDVTYERYSLFADAGLFAARKAGSVHLLELNAPLVDEHARYRGRVLESTARNVERRMLAGTDAVLAVSHPLARWAAATIQEAGLVPPTILVLPNGVDGDSFAAPNTRDSVRRRLGLDARQVITFAGSLKKWHGTSWLIEAAALLGASHPQAVVVVLGDGPERAALESQASDLCAPVRFLGAVPHHDVPALLAASDVGVAPYGDEHTDSIGFYFSPLKIFEYMAAGLPVVASDVGDIGRAIAHGSTGLLVAPGDPLALTAAIGRLLDDPDAARGMGAAARRFVLASHTWDHNARAVLDLAGALRARRAA